MRIRTTPTNPETARSSRRGSRPRLPGGAGADFCVILGEYVFVSSFGNLKGGRVTDLPGPCYYHSLTRRAVQEACPYGLDALHSSHRGLVITETLTASRRECIHAFRMTHPVHGTDKSVPYGFYALHSPIRPSS